MFTPIPRVQVPAAAVKGDIFTVKALIEHQMETGLRKDSSGTLIPRRIINKFVCYYNDATVFSVDLHEAIAADPFIEFYLRATESGELTFEWHEDGGAIFKLHHDLAVT
ncbi:MAG: thiosulfate oxidation carrier complex protein SoxZ [Methylovirgula sp.]